MPYYQILNSNTLRLTMAENSISYTHTNTYTTLNKVTQNTKNIWVVFHGMGYLSKYFVKYFEDLNPEENYIIAPQAPSKYYQDKRFKYIGASWLTKENIETEKENLYSYLDQVWKAELVAIQKSSARLILMGYSQGVSVVTRWMASRKINCDFLLLHSGAIPSELSPIDFTHLSLSTPVTYLYGDKDEYITEARKTEQQLSGTSLFGNRLKIEVFSGVHEVYISYLKKITEELNHL